MFWKTTFDHHFVVLTKKDEKTRYRKALGGRPATVERDRRAGEITRVVPAQPQDQGRHLFGFDEPLDGGTAEEHLVEDRVGGDPPRFRLRLDLVGDEVGANVAGVDAVAGDTGGSAFAGGDLGQSLQDVLRRDVGRFVGAGDQPV